MRLPQRPATRSRQRTAQQEPAKPSRRDPGPRTRDQRSKPGSPHAKPRTRSAPRRPRPRLGLRPRSGPPRRANEPSRQRTPPPRPRRPVRPTKTPVAQLAHSNRCPEPLPRRGRCGRNPSRPHRPPLSAHVRLLVLPVLDGALAPVVLRDSLADLLGPLDLLGGVALVLAGRLLLLFAVGHTTDSTPSRRSPQRLKPIINGEVTSTAPAQLHVHAIVPAATASFAFAIPWRGRVEL